MRCGKTLILRKRIILPALIIGFYSFILSGAIGQTANDYFTTGTNFFIRKQYSEAIPYFRNCMSLASSGSNLLEQANFYLIKSYVKLDDETNVLKELDSLRQRNPNSPALDDLDYDIGFWYFYKNQYTKAAPYFDDLLSNYPDSPYRPEGLLYQMWLKFYDNNNAGIEQAFSQLTTEFPASPKVATGWNEKARFNLMQSNYTEAEQIYNFVLLTYPQYKWAMADAHNGLGEIALQKKNYNDALTHYQSILSLNLSHKWNAIAEDFLGYTYRSQGNLDSARLHYQLIIDTYTDQSVYCAGAQFKIGECYYDQHKLINALSAYQTLLSQYPDSTWTTPAQDKIKLVQKLLGQSK